MSGGQSHRLRQENMKTGKQTENDESLRLALREWRVTTPPPPRFQEQVWRRIERAERAVAECDVSPWGTFVTWLAGAMARPVLAMAYVTTLLMVSLTVGYWQTREKTTLWDKGLAQRYLQAVDPYQQAAGN